MQVFEFWTPKAYFMPQDCYNRQLKFMLLPREEALVTITPNLSSRHPPFEFCIYLKNKSKCQAIVVPPDCTLLSLLQHSSIQHNFVWVRQQCLTLMQRRWVRGIKTYGLLKHAYIVNKTPGLGCGGIGANCLSCS